MLCLRVILIAPWHCTHMLSGATGTLFASPKVESKTDRVAFVEAYENAYLSELEAPVLAFCFFRLFNPL